MSTPPRPELDNTDVATYVSKCHLFSTLSETDISSIADAATIATIREGERFFQQGDPANSFFQVIEGCIKLTRTSSSGNEKVLDIVMPNQTFAEAAMFLKMSRYPVSAEAVTDTTLVKYKGAHYMELLRNSPDACLALLGRMSQRLHWQVEEIERLTMHSATFRLINYLFANQTQSTQQPNTLELLASKQTIASRLSIKPETLSRIFSRLAERDLIKVEHDQIVIINSERLKAFILEDEM